MQKSYTRETSENFLKELVATVQLLDVLHFDCFGSDGGPADPVKLKVAKQLCDFAETVLDELGTNGVWEDERDETLVCSDCYDRIPVDCGTERDDLDTNNFDWFSCSFCNENRIHGNEWLKHIKADLKDFEPEKAKAPAGATTEAF